MAKTATASFVNNHFRMPSLFWFLLLDGGILLHTLVVFFPELIPYSSLGSVIGGFLSYLATEHHATLLYIYYLSVTAHVGEATWAYFICREVGLTGVATLLWTVQTLAVGFPSMTLLRRHRAHCILMGRKSS